VLQWQFLLDYWLVIRIIVWIIVWIICFHFDYSDYLFGIIFQNIWIICPWYFFFKRAFPPSSLGGISSLFNHLWAWHQNPKREAASSTPCWRHCMYSSPLLAPYGAYNDPQKETLGKAVRCGMSTCGHWIDPVMSNQGWRHKIEPFWGGNVDFCDYWEYLSV